MEQPPQKAYACFPWQACLNIIIDLSQSIQAYEGLSKSFLKWEMLEEKKNCFKLTEKEQRGTNQGPNDFMAVLQNYNVTSAAWIHENAEGSWRREKWSSVLYT